MMMTPPPRSRPSNRSPASSKSSIKSRSRKAVETKIQRLLVRDYSEYVKANPIKIEEYAGRKAKSDRTVLVEVFTNVAHPRNPEAMLTLDALLRTYKPADVILVQHHLLLENMPDALANQGAIEHLRASYGKKIQGIPTIVINGKLIPPVTAIKDAKTQYTKLRELIDAQLETSATVKLQLFSERKDKDYVIKAVVSGLEKPGEKVMLRFFLVEDRVRYDAESGVRYHHCVLRDIPGGPEGFPLTKKDAEQTVTVNVETVRGELGKFLNQVLRGADGVECPRGRSI